jgi:hypothetical protein
MGHPRKHPLPPWRKLEVNPFTPFRCQYTIIKTNLSSGLSAPDFRDFFLGVSVDLFWNNPI